MFIKRRGGKERGEEEERTRIGDTEEGEGIEQATCSMKEGEHWFHGHLLQTQYKGAGALVLRESEHRLGVGDDAGEGEYPLVYTELHQAFKTLVEGHVQGVLEKQRHTPQSFVRLVETIEKREGWTWARDGCREVVALLREADDFEAWARELRRKAAARRERARHK